MFAAQMPSGLLGPFLPKREEPVQQPGGIQGLLGNPLLYAGLGLMSNPNAGQGIASGLGAYQSMQAQKLRRDALEQQSKDRAADRDLRKQEIMVRLQRLTNPAEVQTAKWYLGANDEEKAAFDHTSAGSQSTPAAMQVFRRIRELEDAGDLEGAQQLASLHRAPVRFDQGGGGVGLHNPVTGDRTSLVSPEDATTRNAVAAGAQSEATTAGTNRAEAQDQLVGLQSKQAQFEALLNDPSFPGAVGFIDSMTGRIGQGFGTKEGVLGARVEKLSEGMVLEASRQLTGSKSDQDIAMLKRTAPSRSSSHHEWNDWYQNIFLPTVKAAQDRGELGRSTNLTFDQETYQRQRKELLGR